MASGRAAMKVKIASSIILLSALVIAILYWQFRPAEMATDVVVRSQDINEPQPLYWVAPMVGAGLASALFQNLSLPNGKPVFDPQN